MYLPIYLSVCLSARFVPPVYLSVCPSTCLSICPPVYLSVCPSICLPVDLSVFLLMCSHTSALSHLLGFIESDMTSALDLKKILDQIPLGRLGNADEVAGESNRMMERRTERGKEGQREGNTFIFILMKAERDGGRTFVYFYLMAFYLHTISFAIWWCHSSGLVRFLATDPCGDYMTGASHPVCIVLICVVLYCIVLYWIVLYSILLYCIVLYCIVLYCIVL